MRAKPVSLNGLNDVLHCDFFFFFVKRTLQRMGGTLLRRGRSTMYEVEKLKSLGLRAPTSAKNSVANQTNPQTEQDSADPSPRPVGANYSTRS